MEMCEEDTAGIKFNTQKKIEEERTAICNKAKTRAKTQAGIKKYHIFKKKKRERGHSERNDKGEGDIK